MVVANRILAVLRLCKMHAMNVMIPLIGKTIDLEGVNSDTPADRERISTGVSRIRKPAKKAVSKN